MTVFDNIANQYTDDAVSTTLAELRTWLVEEQPELDPYDPVINSVLLAPLAVMLTKQRALTTAISDYGNLSPIPSNSLAADQLLSLRELQASAFGLTLGAGSYAVGDVKLSFSSNESVVLQAQTTFATGAIQFRLSDFYRLVPESEYTGEALERKLLPDVDGKFYVVLPVTAVQAGVTGNISVGSQLQPRTTIPRLVSATAASSFVGGTEATDLATLLRDAWDGLVPKSSGSRDQLIALVRQQPQFSNMTAFGVTGSGDPEMQRDKVSLLPLGIGRVDVYVAAGATPATRTVSLSGIVGDTVDGLTTITVPVGRDDAPGFYRILSAELPGGQPAKIVSVSRGMDISPILNEQVPILEHTEHATFSRFQTATVQLSVANLLVPVEAGQQQTVSLTFSLISSVAELQSFLSSRSVRYPGGDTLVRAAVPLYLEIKLSLDHMFDAVSLDEDKTIERIVTLLQSRPLRTKIYGSEIIAALSDLLGDSVYVRDIVYTGLLVAPDGREQLVGGNWDFSLAVEEKRQISNRTVAMYISAADVRLEFERLVTPEVP